MQVWLPGKVPGGRRSTSPAPSDSKSSRILDVDGTAAAGCQGGGEVVTALPPGKTVLRLAAMSGSLLRRGVHQHRPHRRSHACEPVKLRRFAEMGLQVDHVNISELLLLNTTSRERGSQMHAGEMGSWRS
ncbi:hypothetical protein BS78_10G246900 [Paspalum vaginatum]|nr:hypothetical protein BS78_10G246900 [Paspalum vaginatum]